MISNLEMQSAAVTGFTRLLASNIDEQPTETRENTEQLIGLLQVYETELQRQIEGNLGTKDWHTALTVTSLAIPAYIDAFKEQNPELADYEPSGEPTTTNEMTIRLLSDAGVLFKKSLAEMDQYLEQQGSFGLLDGVIERLKQESSTDE